jgi:hypothetical protein
MKEVGASILGPQTGNTESFVVPAGKYYSTSSNMLASTLTLTIHSFTFQYYSTLL